MYVPATRPWSCSSCRISIQDGPELLKKMDLSATAGSMRRVREVEGVNGNGVASTRQEAVMSVHAPASSSLCQVLTDCQQCQKIGKHDRSEQCVNCTGEEIQTEREKAKRLSAACQPVWEE